jgi:hypothetical protein
MEALKSLAGADCKKIADDFFALLTGRLALGVTIKN